MGEPASKKPRVDELVVFRDDVVLSPGNYGFTVDGTLRHRSAEGDHHQFKFTTQTDYDRLAEEVLAYCQALLGACLDARAGSDGVTTWSSPQGTPDAAKRTLLLLQGSGRVRGSHAPPFFIASW